MDSRCEQYNAYVISKNPDIWLFDLAIKHNMMEVKAGSQEGARLR